MPTIPNTNTSSSAAQKPHQARGLAESFGLDPERYHRTRPRYPRQLVDRILARAVGTDLLDVGVGTGVAARPFAEAGCRVLGVEVDPRMAAFAMQQGIDVEVARFEEWDPLGRSFDATISGQTWHWVDPVDGAAKAAGVLRPGAPLAVFWNVPQPPSGLARAFSEVYRRVLPDTPFATGQRDPLQGYDRILMATTDGIRATGAFDEPERWRFDWSRPYTKEEWLDQVPTFGGHGRFPEAKLEELLTGIGQALDAAGGAFTMRYATLAIVALRAARA